MKIAIVDDEPVWLDKIKRYIEEYFSLIKVKDYEIATFLSGKDFILSMEQIDLLFLDVELKNDENGFELAEEIKSRGNKCKICFLTSHIEFARLGYKVSAYRYIDKIHLDEIDEALASYISSVAKAAYIECKDEQDLICSINIGEAIYVETIQHKLCYHFAGGEKYFSDGNLKSLIDKYGNLDLIQIQRSYVVNMKYVRSYDSRNVTMIDGTALPISRERVQEFKIKYFSWRRKNSI